MAPRDGAHGIAAELLAEEAGDFVGELEQLDRGQLVAHAQGLLHLGPRARWPLPTEALIDRAAHAIAVATLRMWGGHGRRHNDTLAIAATFERRAWV
jgi:hypothetical protein